MDDVSICLFWFFFLWKRLLWTKGGWQSIRRTSARVLILHLMMQTGLLSVPISTEKPKQRGEQRRTFLNRPWRTRILDFLLLFLFSTAIFGTVAAPPKLALSPFFFCGIYSCLDFTFFSPVTFENIFFVKTQFSGTDSTFSQNSCVLDFTENQVMLLNVSKIFRPFWLGWGGGGWDYICRVLGCRC